VSLHNFPKNHLSCKSQGHEKKNEAHPDKVRSYRRTQGGGRARRRLVTVPREEYTAPVPSAGSVGGEWRPRSPLLGELTLAMGLNMCF
jgi:hypothetical protein